MLGRNRYAIILIAATIAAIIVMVSCNSTPTTPTTTTSTSTTTTSILPLPTINSFAASPNPIYQKETSTLSWTTTNADTVSIDQGIGTVALSGNAVVKPYQDTTYTITAKNKTGSTSVSTTVSVKWNLTGTWTGTSWYSGGSNALLFTLSQSGPNVTGTWTAKNQYGSNSGNMTGTVSGNTISGTLTGPGYYSTATGSISVYGTKIDGEGIDSGGRWTFTVVKEF
jgi:hypothetical protein